MSSKNKSDNFPEFLTVQTVEGLKNYTDDVKENSIIIKKDVIIKWQILQKILDNSYENEFGSSSHAVIVYWILLMYYNNKKIALLLISIKEIARVLKKDRKTIRRALYFLYEEKIIGLIYVQNKQSWAVTLLME